MRPVNILLSYPYWLSLEQGELISPDVPVRIFGDSGAFSTFTGATARLGITVNREGYADWVGKHGDRFDAYANLDVIFQPEASKDNLLWLEAQGLTPLPVFHVGDPWNDLHDYR